MSSIGPGLPPHILAKRKRQAEEEAAKTSTSTQVEQSQNLDKRQRIAGPTLPTIEPVQNVSPESKRVIGPSMPPAALDERPPAPPSSDESSDDDYGPSLPSGTDIYTAPPLERNISTEEQAVEDMKPKREGWMTLPPSADGLKNVDPSRLRARGFNTSRHTNPAKGGGIAATWTETPEEKRVRLQKEMLGIVEPHASATPAGTGQHAASANSTANDETKRRIKEYTEKYRGESLMAKHQKGEQKLEEDDPAKRGFDWEKDMNSVGKLTSSNKKEMMNRASDFSRFSGGGYL